MLTQAAVLVGGLGTRLKDLTRETPKPLIDVGGRPFIDYVIDEIARHGITDILLLAGYLGDQFLQRYDLAVRHGATIRVLTEMEPLGTGGAVRAALGVLDKRFLLTNGDSFFDINLRALPEPDSGSITMALCSNVVGDRYGRVELASGRVTGFHEPAARVPGPINSGLYVMSREAVESLPIGRSSIEKDLFPLLAGQRRIDGRIFDGYFIDMGVPEDLARARLELPSRLKRPAVFLDRDGVINVDHGYVHRPADFQWIPGAIDAIRACNDRGYFVFIVSNQAGVARGLYGERDVQQLHAWISGELASAGAHIDAFEYCPHHPDGTVEAYRRDCHRRKPGPGMLKSLLAEWPVDAGRSVLIGDKDSDVVAAATAGVAGHLFKGGNLRDFVADCLGWSAS